MIIRVSDLLDVQKIAAPPPRVKLKSQPSHKAWDLPIQAVIHGQFVVYVRINADLPESFSIGLRYHPKTGAPCVLMRVNGDHGPHRNPDGSRFNGGAHVHAPTQAELAQAVLPGLFESGPQHATLLGVDVLELSEAWHILATRTNIINSAEANDGIAKIGASIGQTDMGF